MLDFRTAFCINCGATLDVAKLVGSMGAAARENVRLVFFDSHRPVHHSLNDENDQNHVLFHNPDGGDVPMEAIPPADDAAGAESALPSSKDSLQPHVFHPELSHIPCLKVERMPG